MKTGQHLNYVLAKGNKICGMWEENKSGVGVAKRTSRWSQRPRGSEATISQPDGI